MATKADRYEGIDGLKAYAIIGIALMHVLANGEYGIGGFVFERLIPSFTNLVFLFMMVSGFGMCCGYYQEIIDQKISVEDFYKKRYIKIWPYFALLCALDFVISPSKESLFEVFANLTLCQGLIRTDLKDIVRELYKKSDRIVISTNGFFTDRIVDLCKEFPQIGIRISIEGLEQTNNEIRGLQNGYQRGYGTLKKLREMGMKDVGFGMTVQDKNAPDLVPLYKISNEMGMEFATASLHNSFYFVEAKNIIHDRPMVAKNFENLVNELLRGSGRPAGTPVQMKHFQCVVHKPERSIQTQVVILKVLMINSSAVAEPR